MLSFCILQEKEGESEEEVVPGREGDLKLTDVAEDMREAVQGTAQGNAWNAEALFNKIERQPLYYIYIILYISDFVKRPVSTS